MSSYVKVNHADWVEQNGAAARSYSRPRKSRDGWIIGWHSVPDALNPFQRRAMHVLGIAGGGIHNAPINWDRVRFTTRFIDIRWRGGLSTFDYSDLTRLVLLAHEARIRVNIRSVNAGELEILLHERSHEGRASERHPNIDEAVAELRSWLTPDHELIYRTGAA